MKLQFSFILCLLLSVPIFGQKRETLGTRDKLIAAHFKNDYKKKNYKRFTGKISVKDNQVQFDDKMITYDKSDNITGLLLREGLIYPQLLTEYQMQKFSDENNDRTQKRFLKLQKDPNAVFDVNNVKLSNATELSFLNSAPAIKRFRITCRDSRIPNTLTYLIELTNKNATKETPIKEFIRNSKLTYLQQL